MNARCAENAKKKILLVFLDKNQVEMVPIYHFKQFENRLWKLANLKIFVKKVEISRKSFRSYL